MHIGKEGLIHNGGAIQREDLELCLSRNKHVHRFASTCSELFLWNRFDGKFESNWIHEVTYRMIAAEGNYVTPYMDLA